MGNPAGNLTLASQTSLEYTSTRSVYKQSINGQVGITATFLSPLTPDDYMRSSLISSYLQVEVVSLDGNDHDVQLYTDISAGTQRPCLSSGAVTDEQQNGYLGTDQRLLSGNMELLQLAHRLLKAQSRVINTPFQEPVWHSVHKVAMKVGGRL